MCLFSSLLNIFDAANSDLLWIRGTAGKAEMRWPVAISLSLKTYGARGKVSESAGELEMILLSHSTVCYPGSHVWSLFYFYMRLKWGVTSRPAEISTPWGKRIDPVWLKDHVGFLFVWLADSGSSCKPHRNVFSRPFCLSGCAVFRHFRAKHCKFSHHPDSPIAAQMPQELLRNVHCWSKQNPQVWWTSGQCHKPCGHEAHRRGIESWKPVVTLKEVTANE